MPGYLTIPEYSAQNISVTPAGNLSSNNIQSALEELDGDLLSGLAEKLGITTASNTYLPIAGGKILQIVRATDSTERSTTSTSYVDVTGMSVTITPQKSDSAILIIAVFLAEPQSASVNTAFMRLQITDSSNNAISGAEEFSIGMFNVTRAGTMGLSTNDTAWAYATPATTSAVTYKLRFRALTDSTAILKNSANTGQMYAIEVSA